MIDKRVRRFRRSPVVWGVASSALVWAALSHAGEPTSEAPERAKVGSTPTPTRASEAGRPPAPEERTAPAKPPAEAAKGLDKAETASDSKAGGESDPAAGTPTADAKSTKGSTLGGAMGLERYQAARRALMEARSAEPVSDEARAAREEALKKLSEARETIRARHREQIEAFLERPEEEREKLEEKVLDHRKKLKKDREERAEKERAKLKEQFGEDALHPAVREELRAHAWRVARLNQVLFLARADEKPKLVERAEKLLEKEKEAHEARIAKLMETPGIKNYSPPPDEGKKGEKDSKAASAENQAPAQTGKPEAAGDDSAENEEGGDE